MYFLQIFFIPLATINPVDDHFVLISEMSSSSLAVGLQIKIEDYGTPGE
jgi:hypothetical protein